MWPWINCQPLWHQFFHLWIESVTDKGEWKVGERLQKCLRHGTNLVGKTGLGKNYISKLGWWKGQMRERTLREGSAESLISFNIFVHDLCSVLSVWWPLATCGYWPQKLWLVWIEMYYMCKIHTGLWKLSTTNIKYPLLII